ncbi:Prolyl tripeptidyl peptidase precursor [Caulifigura coniformis]|uniref:Prolyl tripeptidyl peptidase n=1 Tax=Caulifigura coniformis TaxID=2527983 RepID=A0A517S9U8_9PLAN|nr:S9 family peptidase [Caulifigura coniformis]QDT52893.1 Prolyl tripeptidyl peptidase precursor [Caulifigura coniformis]
MHSLNFLFLLSALVVSAGPVLAADQAPETPPSPEAAAKAKAEAEAKAKEKAQTLTIDRIFTAKEFDGEAAPRITWSKRRPGYYMFVSAKAGVGRDLVYVDPASGEQEVILPGHGFIPPGQTQPIAIDGFEFSNDESKLLVFTNSRRVWRTNTRGDYYVVDIAGRDLRKVGGPALPSTLMFARFSPDGSHVAFVRENNLYVQHLRSSNITQLTRDGSATTINGTADWVYEEELALREGYRWSPDGLSIAYWQFDTTGVRNFYLINNTEGLYATTTPIPYPKVGEQNSAVRIGVVPASGGKTCWMNIPGNSREYYLAQMEWTPSSASLVIQQFNRLQNNNCVFMADAKTGVAKVAFAETDPAWLENENKIDWIDGSERDVWLSERTGWRQAYLTNPQDGSQTPITQGESDVISVLSAGEKQGVYYTASPANPTQCYLYHTPLAGGEARRITPEDQPGWHAYNISPDGTLAIHTRSTFADPPVVDLVKLPGHERVRMLVENKKLNQKLAALRKPSTEFFRIEIGDGVLLDAWAIKPPEMDLNAKYPVLFYVYGEPHGQTVKDMWPGQRGLWYWMLAQQGYIVVSVDSRGTPAPRGREWRKCVYRQVGILPPQDQASAAKKLLGMWPYADPARLGIWGYSGGGSSTLHAMFRFPDVYSTGIAVAGVPNQRLYDSIYQERYMGSPGDNADGYRRGSPISHVAGLKGNLLVIHGTGDDNVHYQGAEVLINELVAHNKPFSMMAYPNRSHSLSEGPGTTRHFYDLMTRYLHENLPARK